MAKAPETAGGLSPEDLLDAYARVDMSGRILLANRPFVELVGHSLAELIAMDFRALTPPEWRAAEEERVLEALERGASEPYEKEYLHRDGHRVPVALRIALHRDAAGHPVAMSSVVRDLTEQRRAERDLRLSRFSMEAAPFAVFRIDEAGAIRDVNQRACESLGYTREELLAMTVFDIDPSFERERWAEHRRRIRERRTGTVATWHRRRDGSRFPVEVTVRYVQYEGEEYSLSFVRDLSAVREAEEAQRRLEAQLHQSQKMESVGRLAGGVAHDFNNMLAVILGHAELAARELPAGHPLREHLAAVEQAAGHARDITRQLLAFSRKQVILPRRLDLNAVVQEMMRALRRLIGEDIVVRMELAPGAWPVRFDPSQVHQILANLVVNARDAMPSGGTLMVETENVTLDAEYCRDHVEATPGDYVVLAVSDDGVGMDADVRAHLFEPFFTTKEPGQGTGLGLATVYGILRQNGGLVNVYSEPGRGSTFRMYLPRDARAEGEAAPPPPVEPLPGSGTVLLVEDDELVRRLSIVMLESLGYTVVAAHSAPHAVAMCADPSQPIDLLVTDVVMPQLNGRELRARARAARPGLPVLFVSGYTANVVVHQGVLEPDAHFLHKPFTRDELARAVRAALARP